jgi:diguanylate cyclase (GGDEF)-like protein/PAS domain S-box-containing protein
LNLAGQTKRQVLRRWVKISGVLLLCAFVALMVSAAVSVRQAHLVRTTTAHRAELNRYIYQLQAVLALVTDAETGQRGYLLTGKEFYLTPYRRATADAQPILDAVRVGPLADAGLTAHVVKIRELATRKLSELAETIRLHDAGDVQRSLGLVQSDVGERAMEEVRQEIADALLIVRKARDASDAAVVKGTLQGEQLEIATLAALLVCGVFAALQAGSLWVSQERYERALGESERRHRAIVEDQTELISIARADGGLEFVNPAFAQFFGFQAEDSSGRSLYDSLSQADRTEWTERMALVLKTDDVLLREQLVPAAGVHGPRWIAWRHRAQHAPDRIVRIHSVGHEITLRKRAEEGLRAREDFLIRIGRVAGVGGWSLDLSTEEIFWSSEVRRIHEVSERYEPTLTQALAFFPSKARETLRQAMQTAIERGVHWDLELPLVTSSGRHIWVRTVGEPESHAQGHVIRLVGAFQDVTERHAIERSLRELTEVFDSTPDFVAQADWRGQVLYLNPAARKAVGIDLDTPLTGRAFGEFYTAATNVRFALEIVPAVKQYGVWVGETQVVLEGGRIVPIDHMVIAHRDANGRVSRYTSLMRDITTEVAGRAALARKTSTLNSIVEAIPAVLAVCDNDMRYQLVNRAFERWRGREREHFIGNTIKQAVDADEFERSLPWVQRVLAGETVVYEKDYPDATEYRHMCVTYTPLRLEDGSVSGFIGLAQDITDHREERLRLLGLSEHDPLTGLLNRAGFEGFLIEKMNRGDGSLLAALYIDLDHFKPVNDQHGHAMGDELLRQFAARLKAVVRPTDAVARLGGDEFGVVLVGVRAAMHAATVADKIVEAALVPFEVGNLKLKISASVGASYNADLEGGWKGLLARADAKAYEAKAAGRGRRVLPNPGDSSLTIEQPARLAN